MPALSLFSVQSRRLCYFILELPIELVHYRQRST